MGAAGEKVEVPIEDRILEVRNEKLKGDNDASLNELLMEDDQFDEYKYKFQKKKDTD